MSVQFGRWNIGGGAIESTYIEKITSVIAPYGPDGGGFYNESGTAIFYRAFHTTKESRQEIQPYISPGETIITWDGRLDNRAELTRDLGAVVTASSTDLEIVAAAYNRWGDKCLARLVGDWALAVWNIKSRTLLLAKDFIGARQLYYTIQKDHIIWCSLLEPLMLIPQTQLRLNEEYIAGWLGFYPASHLTPYVGICSVPPCSAVLLTSERHTIRKFWDFDPGKRTTYARDCEYEEEFRSVFAESVRRRLRSDRPIIAELSGGMDSSSIVCMADAVSSETADNPRIETISYYNDSEPSWNERPFFSKVEEQRGRQGFHIDLSPDDLFSFDLDTMPLHGLPNSVVGATNSSRHFGNFVRAQEGRVVLSGFGGDEVMGGVPTSIPQIQDLLAGCRLREVAHQLKVWALSTRTPWFHILLEAMGGFVSPSLDPNTAPRRFIPWLRSSFIHRNKIALKGYPRRLKLLGALPSVQANLLALDLLRRQLAAKASVTNPLYEKRYPYLDRGLLEFLYSIPRDQMVRVGQRRSLMRRAMRGIVPNEVLDRKRKAFVATRPMTAISKEWSPVTGLCQEMISGDLGIVDQEKFIAFLCQAKNNSEVPLVRLMRTIFLEAWLKHLQKRGLLIHRPHHSVNYVEAQPHLS